MNIATIIKNKYQKNVHIYRNLCETNPNGVLAAGYVQKNTRQGSHYDFNLNYFSGLLVLSGEGRYTDGENKDVLLKPGDFIQRYPYKTHTTTVTSEDWTELYICFGPGLYENLRDMGVITSDKPVLSTGLDYKLIEQMQELLDAIEKANALELSILVSSAIAIISRANYLDRANAHPSEVIEQLNRSIRFIEENVYTRISVEDVAEEVQLGFEKFRKLFTGHFGISPGLYMIHNRIHHAQRMLSENKLSIKEIALELGYADAYAFSKQFKKLMGISPSEFKRLFIL